MNALLALHSGQNQKQTDYSLLGLMNFKSLREKIAESPLKEVVNRGNFYLKKNISKNIYLFKEFQANLKLRVTGTSGPHTGRDEVAGLPSVEAIAAAISQVATF